MLYLFSRGTRGRRARVNKKTIQLKFRRFNKTFIQKVGGGCSRVYEIKRYIAPVRTLAPKWITISRIARFVRVEAEEILDVYFVRTMKIQRTVLLDRSYILFF